MVSETFGAHVHKRISFNFVDARHSSSNLRIVHTFLQSCDTLEATQNFDQVNEWSRSTSAGELVEKSSGTNVINVYELV